MGDFPKINECFRLGIINFTSIVHVKVVRVLGSKVVCTDLLTGAERYFEVRLGSAWYEFDFDGVYTNRYWAPFEVTKIDTLTVKKMLRDRSAALYRKADVAKEEARKFAVHVRETLAAL